MNKIIIIGFVFVSCLEVVTTKNEKKPIEKKEILSKKDENDKVLMQKRNKQDNDVKSYVYNIVKVFNQKNTVAFNQFIHKKTGVYCIFRMGATDYFSKRENILLDKNDASKKIAEEILAPYQNMLYEFKYSDLSLETIEFTNEPYFECEDVFKKGVFVSEKDRYHILSETMQLMKDEMEEKDLRELNKKIQIAKQIEKNSLRIIINSDKGVFIFYITSIEGEWYLTILDFVSNDCSV